MRKCWAESLGHCSESLSREHTVTAGLFDTDTVSVQGLSWCKDAPKIIGLANLTRNILCRAHNSELSVVDNAAIGTRDVLREFSRLGSVRLAIPAKRWSVVRLRMDGINFEKWCLKTLINLTLQGRHPIGPASSVDGEPSVDLVEIAFGLKRFSNGAGLYYTMEVGDTTVVEDRFRIIPLFDDRNESVVGGEFHFLGYKFMLYLDESGIQGGFGLVEKNGAVNHYSRPLRHPKRINFNVEPSKSKVSHRIDVSW